MYLNFYKIAIFILSDLEMAPLPIAGMAFKNRTLLETMLKEVEETGFHPERVLKRACKENGFDMTNPEIFNKNKREIRFNGVRYSDFEALKKRYKEMEERKRNYRENPRGTLNLYLK